MGCLQEADCTPKYRKETKPNIVVQFDAADASRLTTRVITVANQMTTPKKKLTREQKAAKD